MTTEVPNFGFLAKQCYFVNLHGGESETSPTYLPISPDSISVSLSSTYSEQSSQGRDMPLISYSSSSLREVSFDFMLHKDLCDAIDWCKPYEDLINALENCVFPKYGDESKDFLQPRTIFVFGAMRFRGAVTSLSVTWEKPLIEVNGYPMYSNAKVNISFKEINKKAPRYKDINHRNYFNYNNYSK